MPRRNIRPRDLRHRRSSSRRSVSLVRQFTLTSSDIHQGFLSPFFSFHTVERLLANTLTKSTAKQSYKSLADIQSTASSSQLIDILLTNIWPGAIPNFSSAPLSDLELGSIGASILDDTIRRIKPRYHFAAGGGIPPKFWEREPYVWDEEEGRVSRFVSLGAFGGEATTGKKHRVRYLCIHPISYLTLRVKVVLCVLNRPKFSGRHPSTPPRKCHQEPFP